MYDMPVHDFEYGENVLCRDVKWPPDAGHRGLRGRGLMAVYWPNVKLTPWLLN